MQEIDLLIIGSGPAGISTALHLLRKDSSWADRMILVEKAVHPRPKLCGGAVTRIGLESLRDLGFHHPLPIPGVEVDQAQLLFQKRSINFHGRPEFVVYNRIEFDEFLVEEARQRGLVIHENETVRSINLDSRYVEVVSNRKTYHTKVVIGADGSKGITRRLFNQEDSKGNVARVLETIYPARETEAQFIDKFATFNFTPVLQGLQGYFWDFPSLVAGETRFNRGVYDSRRMPHRGKAKLPAILEEEIKLCLTCSWLVMRPGLILFLGRVLARHYPTEKLPRRRSLMPSEIVILPSGITNADFLCLGWGAICLAGGVSPGSAINSALAR
jgi:flavin-dependent dehydrogenase